MMRTSEIVNNLLEVNPSKHLWINVAKKEKIKEKRKKEKIRKKERQSKEREEQEEKKVKAKTSDLSKPAVSKVANFKAEDQSLLQIEKGTIDSFPLFSNQSETLTLTKSDDDCESLEISQPTQMTLGRGGASQNHVTRDKTTASRKSPPTADGIGIQHKTFVEEILKEVLEKASSPSDKKAESNSNLNQAGKTNEVIFRRIEEKDIDLVKDDASWFGDVINLLIVKSSSLLDVTATFETVEEMEAAYIGLCDKYEFMGMNKN